MNCYGSNDKWQSWICIISEQVAVWETCGNLRNEETLSQCGTADVQNEVGIVKDVIVGREVKDTDNCRLLWIF